MVFLRLAAAVAVLLLIQCTHSQQFSTTLLGSIKSNNGSLYISSSSSGSIMVNEVCSLASEYATLSIIFGETF